MIFHEAKDPYDWLHNCYESENGRWQVGWAPRTFGRYQLTITLKGAMETCVEYCCGDDYQGQMLIWLLVMAILAKMPEEVRVKDLIRTFPAWKLRPVYEDHELVEKLEALASANVLPMMEKPKRGRPATRKEAI